MPSHSIETYQALIPRAYIQWEVSSVLPVPLIGTYRALTPQKLLVCPSCSRVLHRSTKIYAHGKIAFHTHKRMVSSSDLAVHIKTNPTNLRTDPFVLLIANKVIKIDSKKRDGVDIY